MNGPYEKTSASPLKNPSSHPRIRCVVDYFFFYLHLFQDEDKLGKVALHIPDPLRKRSGGRGHVSGELLHDVVKIRGAVNPPRHYVANWAWQRTISVAAKHQFTDSVNQSRRCRMFLTRPSGFSELTL